MRRFVISILGLISFELYASGCADNFDETHDFVAIVKIENRNHDYESSFNAKIERVIYRYGEGQENFKESKLFEIQAEKTFVLVESEIVKRKISDDFSSRRQTTRVESIRTHSCQKKYKVGSRVRLFAKEVGPNIYKSSSSWTKVLNENS